MIRCLIIDDEPLSRNVLRTFVSDHPDLELVGECKDAFEAMDLLNKNSVDLLFLDINMPKLSGFEFLKTIKNKKNL